jgi:hypothetical protein
MWVSARKKGGWLKKADQQKRTWLLEKSNAMANIKFTVSALAWHGLAIWIQACSPWLLKNS